jgi:hypothetical protein
VSLSPIKIGRKIANSFWGKSWCENLERYSDVASRLPRGRSSLAGANGDLSFGQAKCGAKLLNHGDVGSPRGAGNTGVSASAGGVIGRPAQSCFPCRACLVPSSHTPWYGLPKIVLKAP